MISPEEAAIRAHDITVCLEANSVPEFEQLSLLGRAVKLALHLRGVPAVRYELLRDVAIYILNFPPSAVKPTVELLAEAEFAEIHSEGRTIKTVVPNVPFYQRIFTNLATVAGTTDFSEPEQLALDLLQRLAAAPLLRDHAYQLGAEKKIVDRILDVGSEAAFISMRRARGRDVLLSPTYFPESGQAYADLVAGHGAGRVKRILDLLRRNQGWPLSVLEKQRELSGDSLDDADLAVIRALAGEGFIPPPAIHTTYRGTNYFLFGPRPGTDRLPPSKRPIFEAAMALVSAVRQGQLLPSRYKINHPLQLLLSLKEKRFLRANTEATQQYRQVCLLKVGKLVRQNANWARFVMIERPENEEALDLAITLVRGHDLQISSTEDVKLAILKGESYVESLIGRKRLIKEKVVVADEESMSAIDDFLLRGRE